MRLQWRLRRWDSNRGACRQKAAGLARGQGQAWGGAARGGVLGQGGAGERCQQLHGCVSQDLQVVTGHRLGEEGKDCESGRAVWCSSAGGGAPRMRTACRHLQRHLSPSTPPRLQASRHCRCCQQDSLACAQQALPAPAAEAPPAAASAAQGFATARILKLLDSLWETTRALEPLEVLLHARADAGRAPPVQARPAKSMRFVTTCIGWLGACGGTLA